MQVTILFFAAAREAAGTSSAAVELPEGASVADLFVHLRERIPQLSGVLSGCRAAVDEEFAAPTTTLSDGATVAVLPPVSGG